MTGELALSLGMGDRGAGRCTAQFSPCRTWRYTLTRSWADGGATREGSLIVIGLNPSTADERRNDPTIRRCIGYAQHWGFDGLVMLNLFAFRATDPTVMMRALDPIGPANDRTLLDVTRDAPMILCAWGAGGAFQGRGEQVRRMLRETGRTLHVLALTKDGHPRHPLYLRKDLTPVRWMVPLGVRS